MTKTTYDDINTDEVADRVPYLGARLIMVEDRLVESGKLVPLSRWTGDAEREAYWQRIADRYIEIYGDPTGHDCRDRFCSEHPTVLEMRNDR